MSDVPASSAPAAAPVSTPASTNSQASAPVSKGSAPGASNANVSSGGGSKPSVTTPAGASSVTPDVKAGPPGETPAEKKARKYQIKVDGKTSEIDLDSMDDETLVKRIQLAEAAQRRMQEAAEQRKQVESLFEMMKKDPIAALKDPALDIDIRKRIEEDILREYEEAQLPEQERKYREQERQLAEREAKIKEFETRQQQASQKQLEERVFQETQTSFMEALELADVPKNRETIYMMADIARINLENGIELSPAQLAAEVKERVTGMHTHITRSLDGEKLMSYLGDDIITKVLKYAVEQVKGTQNETAFKAPSGQIPKPAFDENGRMKRVERNHAEVKAFFKNK